VAQCTLAPSAEVGGGPSATNASQAILDAVQDPDLNVITDRDMRLAKASDQWLKNCQLPEAVGQSPCDGDVATPVCQV
jgi:hypothetical protein